MVRQIHTDTETNTDQQDPIKHTSQESVQSTAAPQPAMLPANQDALAGALPDWDLLPATAFVRRQRS
ncbi:hypothetical protein ACLPHM_16185 [Paenalcaligenes sp. Me131]|uniref:hypothetical protein n=1 Tax=Paenalcaligenes sp. Me131 TaxID=3392636 RepID=UPI003D265BB4